MDDFLTLYEYDKYNDTSAISAEQAKEKAYAKYDKFRSIQDKEYLSDFDKEIKKRMEGKYYYNMSLMSLCKKLKKKVKYLRKHFNAITNYYLKQYDNK